MVLGEKSTRFEWRLSLSIASSQFAGCHESLQHLPDSLSVASVHLSVGSLIHSLDDLPERGEGQPYIHQDAVPRRRNRPVGDTSQLLLTKTFTLQTPPA